MSASARLCFSCLRSCLPCCLPVALGCFFSFFWVCLPACLQSCLPVGLGCCVCSASCLPAGLGCCVPLGLSPSLSPILSSSWSGMLRPPPWACLPACLQSCIPSCLPAGLGCCVPLPGLVSQLVSHLVFQLVWDAASPSLGLSPSLSPILSSSWSGMLRPPPWACLPACLQSCIPSCLPAGLGCCVPLPGLVSQLVSHLVFQLVWDAAPPSLGLSPSLSPILYPILSSSWSGMLRPPPPSLVLSPILSSSWSGMLCLLGAFSILRCLGCLSHGWGLILRACATWWTQAEKPSSVYQISRNPLVRACLPMVFKPKNFDFSVCQKKKTNFMCDFCNCLRSMVCNLLLFLSCGLIGPTFFVDDLGPKPTMAIAKTCTCCNIPLNIKGFKSPDVRHGKCDTETESYKQTQMAMLRSWQCISEKKHVMLAARI